MVHKNEKEAKMSAESKDTKRFMPPMGETEVTIVETADLTMVLKAMIEQNEKLMALVESILNTQMLEKTLDRQYQQERQKRQDELTDLMKSLLPTLLEWIKPSQPLPNFPFSPARTEPAPKVPYKRRARR